jgi:hypothetical protein
MPHRSACLVLLLVILVTGASGAARAVDLSLRGEAAAAVTVNDVEPRSTYFSGRYQPELFAGVPLMRSTSLDALVSVELSGTDRVISLDETDADGDAEFYRAWLRLAGNQFEARVGRQKIAFGSATLLRPLMWFDRLDPRDPLQITEGVDALLVRYYFLNNANVWLWGLLGNDEPKGWELLPTSDEDPEYGGRLQVPAGAGELAASYHHRRADASAALPPPLPGLPAIDPLIREDRYALDGKWDATVGLWFEAMLVHQHSGLLTRPYRRLAVAGLDYTFDLGEGLTVMGEHFLADVAEKAFGAGEGSATSAFSVRYRWGVVDELSAIFYYDWKQDELYSFGSWRRTYDHWAFNLLTFANPDAGSFAAGQPRSELLAGTGAQILVSYNH